MSRHVPTIRRATTVRLTRLTACYQARSACASASKNNPITRRRFIFIWQYLLKIQSQLPNGSFDNEW